MTSDEATGRFADIVDHDRRTHRSSEWRTAALVLQDRLGISGAQAQQIADRLQSTSALARQLPEDVLRSLMGT